MKTDLIRSGKTTVAASVAPEDLKCGDFVAVLKEEIELPSYLWLDLIAAERETLVRVRLIPTTAGMPLKVKAICLPFVFVKPPVGQCETIDIRRIQLARLNESYGKKVWKNLRQAKSQADSPSTTS